MKGHLRDQVEHPGLRLKRSKDQLQAPVSLAGRSLGCEMTTEMQKGHPRAWVTSVMFKLEGTELPSVPLLTLCVTKDKCENAPVPCNKADLMDKNRWLGLLVLGEETAFLRAKWRTRRDLLSLTQ